MIIINYWKSFVFIKSNYKTFTNIETEEHGFLYVIIDSIAQINWYMLMEKAGEKLFFSDKSFDVGVWSVQDILLQFLELRIEFFVG